MLDLPVTAAGRFVLGALVLSAICATQEAGPWSALAAVTAAVVAALTALCRNELPPGPNPGAKLNRGAPRYGSLLRFIALWGELMGVLGACSACARTLSACLDDMAGGKVRILILGREALPQETWPDVLGVAIIILVTGMFMLGLESSCTFTILAGIGSIGCGVVLITASVLRGDPQGILQDGAILPLEWNRFLTATSLLCSAFSPSFPADNAAMTKATKRFRVTALYSIPAIVFALMILSLNTLIKYRGPPSAAPLLTVLEPLNLHPAEPAMSCLLLLGLSGALVDLFPSLPAMLARLASPAWKLLARSLLYESPESGSPVLAIFAAGSLCAILSFACPIHVLIRLAAAGALISGTISAIEVLALIHKPTHTSLQEENGSSYRRLPQPKPPQMKDKRGPLWFLRPSVSCPAFGANVNRTQQHKREEREREWLLLGEPSSPLSPTSPRDPRSPLSSPELLESALVSQADQHSDSTDIDAAVDEYRNDAPIIEPIIERPVPTIATWRRSIVLISCVCCFSAIFATAVILEMMEATISFAIVISLISGLFWWLPRRTSKTITASAAIFVIIVCILLIAEILPDTWPAVTAWMTAGIVVFARFDLCCNCSDELRSFKIPRPARLVSTPRYARNPGPS